MQSHLPLSWINNSLIVVRNPLQVLRMFNEFREQNFWLCFRNLLFKIKFVKEVIDAVTKSRPSLFLIKHHVMKVYRGLEVQLHAVTSVPDGDQLYPSPVCSWRRSPPHPSDMGLGGPQNRSARGVEVNYCSCRKANPGLQAGLLKRVAETHSCDRLFSSKRKSLRDTQVG
jgi:hypothetical protein